MLTNKSLFIFLIFLFYAGDQVISQIGEPINDRRPSKAIPKHPENRTHKTQKLAEQITFSYTTDLEKATAIFKWISTNISYDHELRNNPQLQKEFYASEAKVIDKVLERKKALCGGYAFLFKALCTESGIESEVIHGFSKKYSLRKKQRTAPDHSWNALKIKGQWYLLDLTAAVSHGSKNSPDMYWFQTEPSYFIKTHYPQHAKWSLLKNPMSLSEFEGITSAN